MPLTALQEQTLRFVREQFAAASAGTAAQRDYRLRHTLRVAALGRRVARGEGFSEDALVIACLLHDLSYIEPFLNEAAWLAHGRRAAQLSRPFLNTLPLDPAMREEILYGIAIHVDDAADFPGERTPLALSVGDCDNLDRYDAYRIYENLERARFSAMDASAQAQFCKRMQQRLAARAKETLATPTADALFQDRVAFQTAFYNRLAAQLQSGDAFCAEETKPT